MAAACAPKARGEGAGATFTLVLPIQSGVSAEAGNRRVTVESDPVLFAEAI
jgi:hypothetical protein